MLELGCGEWKLRLLVQAVEVVAHIRELAGRGTLECADCGYPPRLTTRYWWHLRHNTEAKGKLT